MHEVQGTVVPYLCTRIEHPRQKFQFHIYPARRLPNHHVRLGGKVHFLTQHNARTTVCLHAPPKQLEQIFCFFSLLSDYIHYIRYAKLYKLYV